MKRKFWFLLCACILVLTACGGGTPVKEGEIGVIDESNDFFDYEIVKLEIVDTIRATQGQSLYYEPKDTNNSFLDLVLKVENKSTKDINVNELLEGTYFDFEGVENTASIYTEEDALSSISPYGVIKPNVETFVHVAVEVEPDTVPENIDLTLKIDTKETKLKLNREVLKEKKVELTKGEVMTKEDSHELTYVDSYLSDKLDSPTSRSYYEADADSTYVIVEFIINNMGSSDLLVDDLINSKAIAADKYEYRGSNIVDTGSRLSSYERIKPMTSAPVYLMIEIPKKVEDEKITVRVNISGETRYVEVQ